MKGEEVGPQIDLINRKRYVRCGVSGRGHAGFFGCDWGVEFIVWTKPQIIKK